MPKEGGGVCLTRKRSGENGCKTKRGEKTGQPGKKRIMKKVKKGGEVEGKVYGHEGKGIAPSGI